MINVLKYWKKIIKHIFGTKEFKTALVKSEDKADISSKNVPILIFYPTDSGRPKDCLSIRGVRTHVFDEKHQQIDIWYSKQGKDYTFFTNKDRFSKMVMIPPTELGIKRVMRYGNLVMTNKKETSCGTEITYIGRPIQEERHV